MIPKVLNRVSRVVALAGVLAGPLVAAQPWEEVLRSMPLPVGEVLINRENCISICLTNFESNSVVKALVFLPGVSDDFYLINRDRPKLDIRAANLFDALRQITNATRLRLSFQSSLLLVHSQNDSIEPRIMRRHPATADAMAAAENMSHLVCVDMHWDALQPILRARLGVAIRPSAKSQDAWHFARHNFAVWNLSDLAVLSCVSLTGGTSAIIDRKRVTFKARKAP